MNATRWTTEFKLLYDKALEKYGAGCRDAAALFTKSEVAALASIGARPVELFDFAEDSADISWETALLITSMRRGYFLFVQHGKPSEHRVPMEEFPEKKAEVAGIPWLPRLILKAQARLRGELPDALMYCCGGDRGFFKRHTLHPADFLRVVWATDGDEEKIVRYVRGGETI